MNNPLILIDDDRDFIETLKRRLTDAGFKNMRTVNDPLKAAALFEKGEVFDIALIDMTMPGMGGIELLQVIKNSSPRTECIMVTAVNEARVAVECLNKGAYDYLVKPISQGDLVFSMNRVLEKRRLLDILDIEKSKTLPRLIDPKPFKPIVTRSPRVVKVLKEAELHAGSEVPILITGESGTGKELLARAIHAAGNLPLELQGKLLRVLQDGEYFKLGTSSRHQADVRFIAATNEALDKLVAQKRFRKDLYYRIRGGWLHLPPLRERPEDIPLLADKFLKDYCGPDNICRIEEESLCLLMEYEYPGNIRELQSIIQSAVNLSQGRPISLQYLPDHLKRHKSFAECQNTSASEAIAPLNEIEKTHIIQAYQHTGRNKSQTARLLGIGLNTLRRKLKSYGLG